MEVSNPIAVQKTPWNKGKLVGQKQPLRLKEIAGKGIANVGAARAALLRTGSRARCRRRGEAGR
jgi:hypothetical protein